MRTIVDIPDTQIKILDQISKKKKISRAEVIRLALNGYVTSHNKIKTGYKEAFGIWKSKKKLDSISYQQKLRNEWSE
ncbi:MAG: ribbon-helix-helix domain-containing protein [Rickettsia endosymbiont of Bryobia graminum]|nr:ribbon-helix-helix domain-containing protein [Rickettsia endosymbiont of Bryobia graminum]